MARISLVLSLLAHVCVASSVTAPKSTFDYATFQVTDSVLQSKPINGRFVGFSIEVSSAAKMLAVGGKGGPVRMSYANLMNGLRTASHSTAGPNIRIGGNSADISVYLPTGELPAGDSYRITDSDMATYATAVPQWNGTIALDVNFRNPTDAGLAVAHAQAASRVLGGWPLIESIEVGNEVDLFYQDGIRNKSYAYADYKGEFAVYAGALNTILPAPRIQGATWCHPAWAPNWTDYVTSFGPAVFSSLSYHRYAESSCAGHSPTMAALMADAASAGIAEFLAPLARTAAAARIPFFVGEGNSISCGGAYNLSDVGASALWALDTLFNVAAVGVERWNFHGGPDGAYAAVAYDDITVDMPDVRPMYYGLRAFAEATASNSVLYSVKNVTGNNGFIKAWAVTDDARATRVIVLHKDYRIGSTNASITIVPVNGGDRGGTAVLTRLDMGPKGVNATSRDGITIGGQTFTGSTDGEQRMVCVCVLICVCLPCAGCVV